MLIPEKRDVNFAHALAMDEYRDIVRCRRDYGEASEEFRLARMSYESAWTHYLETLRAYEHAADTGERKQ